MHIYRSNLLHTVEKLLVSARGLLSNSINTPENFAKIDSLERAFSVAQHHGTLVDTKFLFVNGQDRCCGWHVKGACCR